MHTLICATGNAVKFEIGKALLSLHDIQLEQVVIDIDEIQGEDPEVVVRDKARKAFELIRKPVIVSDDSWSIPALNGFPGPYMKSINRWFTPADFIRLTSELTNKRIFLQQILAYQDAHETVVFRSDIPGTLTTEARGNAGPPIMKVVVLNGDGDLTISQVYDQKIEHESNRLKRLSGAWQQLAVWYEQKVTL